MYNGFMRKNHDGFGIAPVLMMVVVIGLVGISGWLVYSHQMSVKNNGQNAEAKKEPATNQKSASQANTQVLKAPSDLKITPEGGGYNLTWNMATSESGIAKYQVFYQGNLLAEPTTNSYKHNLPPPPPGCTPISLTYYVKAVDNADNTSDSSNSVIVKFGGCGT